MFPFKGNDLHYHKMYSWYLILDNRGFENILDIKIQIVPKFQKLSK